ncbi:MAG: hypothetical protein WKG07_09210 [Hymenobacter sp.]
MHTWLARAGWSLPSGCATGTQPQSGLHRAALPRRAARKLAHRPARGAPSCLLILGGRHEPEGTPGASCASCRSAYPPLAATCMAGAPCPAAEGELRSWASAATLAKDAGSPERLWRAPAPARQRQPRRPYPPGGGRAAGRGQLLGRHAGNAASARADCQGRPHYHHGVGERPEAGRRQGHLVARAIHAGSARAAAGVRGRQCRPFRAELLDERAVWRH